MKTKYYNTYTTNTSLDAAEQNQLSVSHGEIGCLRWLITSQITSIACTSEVNMVTYDLYPTQQFALTKIQPESLTMFMGTIIANSHYLSQELQYVLQILTPQYWHFSILYQEMLYCLARGEYLNGS